MAASRGCDAHITHALQRETRASCTRSMRVIATFYSIPPMACMRARRRGYTEKLCLL